MKVMHFLPAVLVGVMSVGMANAAEDNVHFSGALVSEPCKLPDSDTDIKIDFNGIVLTGLYEYQRSVTLPIMIRLTDCDPTVMGSANVKFEGTPDAELTEMLALDTSSAAKGVAIALEEADGSPLAINKESQNVQLATGSNVLTYGAHVQAQPSAVTQQKITPGVFTSTATFVIGYQ